MSPGDEVHAFLDHQAAEQSHSKLVSWYNYGLDKSVLFGYFDHNNWWGFTFTQVWNLEWGSKRVKQ